MGLTLTPPAIYVEDLLRQHYFMIPVPEVLERLYIRAHELWEILCNHYGEMGLLKFSFKLYVGDIADGLTSEVDDGYLPRGGVRPEDGIKYDAKHTWHHRPRLWPHMRASGALDDPVMGAVWTEFMLVNDRIWEIHRDAVMRFATGLDAHPITKNFGFAHSLAKSMWLMPLRHVLYLPGGATGNSMVVGKPHHDRNSFTFHGFQCVGTVQAFIGGHWIELPTLRHHLRGFPGILAALETGGDYDPDGRCAIGGVIQSVNHRGSADPSQPGVPRKASVSFGMHRTYRIQ